MRAPGKKIAYFIKGFFFIHPRLKGGNRMIGRHLCTAVGSVLSLFAVAALLLIPGCYEEEMSSQGSTVKNPAQTNTVIGKPLPQRGKQKLAAAPTSAVFGMIYINTTDNREYIYDGAQWVPHDQTVDDYYRSIDSMKTRMPAEEVFPTGPPLPSPTGAHGKHAAFVCKTCHVVGGVFSFDPIGAAVAPSPTPLPSFNASTKTCSNVACHGVPAGTFSYYFPGNETDADGYPIPELKTVHYGGSMAASTPSWYATGVGCSACHGNPPANGSDGSNAWHSGFHANNQNVGAIPPNACELCHNDPYKPFGTWVPIAFSAVGTDGKYHGTQINPSAASRHSDGTATVYAKFVSQCFGCH